MPEFNMPAKREESNHPSQYFTAARRERLSSPMNTMGKIPPQAVDLEEGILGSILYDSDSFIEIADIIKPYHFYTEANKKVMEAIFDLFAEGEPIEELTVVQKMRSFGTLEMVGGQYYIANLSNSKRAGSNIEYHARLVMQKYMQREMIRTSSEAINSAYEDTTDIFELIEKNQTDVYNIMGDTHKKKAREFGDLSKEAMEELKVPTKEGLTGVGSGFVDLDSVTGGWQKSDLVIIAARPAMGKTAFVIEMGTRAAFQFHKPVAVFSLEMSSLQLTNRVISNKTSVKLEDIRKKKVSDQQQAEMQVVLDGLDPSKLIIDDTAALNIFEFRAKCRRLKAQYDIEMIIVDYLQLMHGDSKSGNNREGEIGSISRALKSVAKELDVPVLALSQLSRAVEMRANKRPMLSDLRESGSIEQDADMVIFLHRPEYYGITKDESGRSVQGLTELIIAKHRNGVCENVPLEFNGAFMRFKDWQKPKPGKQEEPELEFGAAAEISYSDHVVSKKAPF